MGRLILIAVASIALAACGLPATANDDRGNVAPARGTALVIGNGAYAHVRRLPNPANDARAIASALRDLGFDVAEGIDLDRTAMAQSVADFVHRRPDAPIALLFYAGHGLTVDRTTYLVPTDVDPASGTAILSQLIDLDTILAGLDDRSGVKVVLFDASRDNPLPKRIARVQVAPAAGGVTIQAPGPPGSASGTVISYATRPGEQALDGTGPHSPFSAAILRHLARRGLEVQQMLTLVRTEVNEATKGQQLPWSISNLVGEVFLAGPPR